MHFVEAINLHDVDGIYALLTADHVFVDAAGNEVKGRDAMRAGWSAYFQWFPDYKIEVSSIFADPGTVAAFGFASGTFKNRVTANHENFWKVPAAWKAVIHGDKISVWQVYADTKIPFDIIHKNK